MPFPKIKASGVADITKEDEENNSLDTFIRQAIGKESLLSYSRVNDSPVPWIQLLHALDQQDLPGWPLLAPLKIQMQKCEKCSREFCSTINYRRHMRLHRRNLNIDKDSTTKNRSLLQAFWDKLSVEKTMEMMSFEDVLLEGVTGHSIIKKLASFIRKPFTSLPQSYLRAGSALLDIVQGRPSRFPVSSQELFGILDDASEKTFLCAGTAVSLQKYVFDGEAGKNGLEMRNSIACTSFLVEQKLVKACLADKDAEALRYQKLLVEEEEAAQKRQAAVLEKKRQKKLRQKEQKVKEQANAETDYPEDRSTSPSSSSPVFTSDSNLEMSAIPCSPLDTPEPVHIANPEGYCDEDHEIGYPDSATCQNVEHKMYRSGRRHVINSRWQAPKLQRSANGFHSSHNYHILKPGPTQKHVSYRDFRTANAPNGGKVWTPKTKSETDEESSSTRLQVQAENLPKQYKKSEVLIGSISVTLRNQSGQKLDENLGRALETCALEPSVPTENSLPNKVEAVTSVVNRSATKLRRSVSRLENGGQLPVQNCNDVSVLNRNESVEAQLGCQAENNSSGHEENPNSSVDGEYERGSKFDIHAAKAFLAKRWKEVISSDHVTLVLYPEEVDPTPPGHVETQHDSQSEVTTSIKSEQDGIPTCNIETTPQSSGISTLKIRGRLDKGSKVKYIPKQRSVT